MARKSFAEIAVSAAGRDISGGVSALSPPDVDGRMAKQANVAVPDLLDSEDGPDATTDCGANSVDTASQRARLSAVSSIAEEPDDEKFNLVEAPLGRNSLDDDDDDDCSVVSHTSTIDFFELDVKSCEKQFLAPAGIERRRPRQQQAAAQPPFEQSCSAVQAEAVAGWAAPPLAQVAVEGGVPLSGASASSSSKVYQPPRNMVEEEPLLVRWRVEEGVLHSDAWEVTSPPFTLLFGREVRFQLVLKPRPSVSLNTDPTFRLTQGKGRMYLRCLDDVDASACCVATFRFWLGSPDWRIPAAARGPICHNFALMPTRGLPRSMEEWDLSAYVGADDPCFEVAVEILATGLAAKQSAIKRTVLALPQ